MRRWIAALSALCSCALPFSGAAAPVSHSLSPSMSSAITRLGEYQVHSGRTPGIVIAIVEDGRIAYARGFGYANSAKKLSAAADTEFYLGDLTHQFVAAAVLMLLQDGKLKLDDKVTQYVPQLTVASNVTVGQLLQQTSGLPSYFNVPHPGVDVTRPQKIADFIASLNAMKPDAAPGTTYEDNPINYLLAGVVVERAGGEPLSDFLQQRIFVPLVMDRTFVAGDTGISPAHAAGYTHGAGGFVPVHAWDPAWLGGDRGLISTAYDLAKWDIEMPLLLHVDAVRTMLTPSAAPGTAHPAMGWIVDQRGGNTLDWYAGQLAGYQSANDVLPDSHIAVIVLANTDALHGGHTVSAEQLAAHVVDIVAPPPTAHLDNAVVTRAKEWLSRLADKNVDRAQLTPQFSTYLSDDLVSRANFAALGKLQAIVPVSSTAEPNGDTLYEFIVQYPHGRYHYKFALTKDGKIDELTLVD